MPRFSPRLLGDLIQIAASVGVILVLILMVVEATRTQRLVQTHGPAEAHEMSARPAAATSPGAISPGAVPLATSADAGTSPPAVTDARQRQLAAFVHERCTLCHGKEGSLGPLLSGTNLQHLSVNAVSLTILHGRLNKGMPAWETELSPADAHWVAGYLKQGGFVD